MNTDADQENLNSEEIDIQIVADSPEESGTPVNPDDELENYTKSVSKRINKLNAKNKETEQRAAQLEQIAMQKEQELQQYRALTTQQSNTVLVKEAEAVKAKTAQIDEVYRQAVRSGDAESRREHSSRNSSRKLPRLPKLCHGTKRIRGTETKITKKICRQHSLLTLRTLTF